MASRSPLRCRTRPRRTDPPPRPPVRYPLRRHDPVQPPVRYPLRRHESAQPWNRPWSGIGSSRGIGPFRGILSGRGVVILLRGPGHFGFVTGRRRRLECGFFFLTHSHLKPPVTTPEFSSDDRFGSARSVRATVPSVPPVSKGSARTRPAYQNEAGVIAHVRW